MSETRVYLDGELLLELCQDFRLLGLRCPHFGILEHAQQERGRCRCIYRRVRCVFVRMWMRRYLRDGGQSLGEKYAANYHTHPYMQPEYIRFIERQSDAGKYQMRSLCANYRKPVHPLTQDEEYREDLASGSIRHNISEANCMRGKDEM